MVSLGWDMFLERKRGLEKDGETHSKVNYLPH